MYYICELNHDQGSFTLGVKEGAKNIQGATFCFGGVHFNLQGDEGDTVQCFCWKGGSGFRYFLHLSRNIESKPLNCCIVKFVHFFSFVIKDLKKCPKSTESAECAAFECKLL